MTDAERTNEEKNIYYQYIHTIAPFVVELEVRDGEYPIEILNEIRSVFTHMARYKENDSERDLISAGKHIKRGILDCYKYLCVSMAEEMKDFRDGYRHVDMMLADNGNFLPKLDKLELCAKKSYVEAKKAEIRMDITDDELYGLFENAYNDYSTLIQFKDDSEEAILFASNHSKKNMLLAVTSIVIGIVGVVLAVVFYIWK